MNLGRNKVCVFEKILSALKIILVSLIFQRHVLDLGNYCFSNRSFDRARRFDCCCPVD